MKINGFGQIEPSTSTTRRKNVSGTGSFAELLGAAEAAETSSSVPVTDIAATAALNNLLALQEISEEDIKRKKLIQRGNSLLESLELLRQQLLIGTLPPQILLDISRQMAVYKENTQDPKINEIIEEIELRAAVELAKIHKALEDRY